MFETQAASDQMPVKAIIWLNFRKIQSHKCVLTIFTVGKSLGERKFDCVPEAPVPSK